MAIDKVKANSESELKDKLVAINRVTKVTKGGRTFTFAAIVVVGDGKGTIGCGLGKAGEVTAAIAKGTEAAKKNMVKVPVINGTIPHEIEVRFGGAQVFLQQLGKVQQQDVHQALPLIDAAQDSTGDAGHGQGRDGVFRGKGQYDCQNRGDDRNDPHACQFLH